MQPPAERSPRPPSGVRGGSPPEQRVWDQGRQHQQPDHEKHAHTFILTRSPKLTHFAPFRAGRKSGPVHILQVVDKNVIAPSIANPTTKRSPDPISSYWAAEAPACRRVPNPLEEILARIRDGYAPKLIVTATLGDLAGSRRRGTLGGRAKSLVNGRSAFHVENRPRLTGATARRNEQPRARGGNGQTVAFQWS